MKTAGRMLVRMAGLAALAAVLVTMAACGPAQAGATLHPETTAPMATLSSPHTTTPPTTASTAATSSNNTRFWNVDTVQEAEQIAGYTIYSPAYIPSGFMPGSAFMVETMGIGPNAYKVVDRIWTLTSDHTVHIELIQSPRDLEPGNSQPAEVAGTTGERSQDAIGGQPGVELGWQKGTAYFVLNGVMKTPLTEDVLDKIAGSIQ